MSNNKISKKKLSPEEGKELLRTLKARFENNMNRHKGLEWTNVQARLEANTEKLWPLNEMELVVIGMAVYDEAPSNLKRNTYPVLKLPADHVKDAESDPT